jgi:hypothetical protein
MSCHVQVGLYAQCVFASPVTGGLETCNGKIFSVRPLCHFFLQTTLYISLKFGIGCLNEKLVGTSSSLHRAFRRII